MATGEKALEGLAVLITKRAEAARYTGYVMIVPVVINILE
jgi:hypothetical protein